MSETFSQKLRRLAHELHGMPLDAPRPGRRFPVNEPPFEQRLDAIFAGRDPWSLAPSDAELEAEERAAIQGEAVAVPVAPEVAPRLPYRDDD